MGLAPAWPSAAYEDVIESMTDWAFSWPISGTQNSDTGSEYFGTWTRREDGEVLTDFDSNPTHFVHGCDRCCELFVRSSSHG